MEDRFTRGFIAGLIAWVPAGLFNLAAFYLHFSTLFWADFIGIIITNDKPDTLLEKLFTLAGMSLFLGILGIGFVYLVTLIKSPHLVFKGWLYGAALWFVFYVVTLLFKVPYLTNVPYKTALSNLLAASLWGITLALALLWIENKRKIKS